MDIRWMRTACLAGALALAATMAPAWGMYGHGVAGEIAELRLTPAAKDEVNELLGGKSLGEMSTWADKVRPDRPETAPLHYLNFPAELDRPRAEDLAIPEGNVYTAVTGYAARLEDESLPPHERTEALLFLIHFVEDLHQPLHCGLAADLGGNKVRVAMEDGGESNLHRVWDSGILRQVGETSETGYAEKLLSEAPPERIAELAANMNVVEWVVESRMTMNARAYELGAGNPPLVSDEYLRTNLPVVEERLLAAGVRLGALLNALLDEGRYPLIGESEVFPAQTPETVPAVGEASESGD